MTDNETINEIINSVKEDNRIKLTEYESKKILSACDIPITEIRLAKSKLEAVEAARIIKYPVVAKVSSPDVLEKSKAGGVRVGLASEIEVRHAFDDIIANVEAQYTEAEIWGVTIQEFIPQGREVIIGVIQDPSFGPTLMFGLGGIWVNVLKDLSFRIPPISNDEALKMIRDIKGYSTLQGIRGENPADIESIAEIIQKIGDLVIKFDDISEIELNPVFVLDEGEGSKSADALITLRESKG